MSDNTFRRYDSRSIPFSFAVLHRGVLWNAFRENFAKASTSALVWKADTRRSPGIRPRSRLSETNRYFICLTTVRCAVQSVLISPECRERTLRATRLAVAGQSSKVPAMEGRWVRLQQ
jgi:hypothetical protein